MSDGGRLAGKRAVVTGGTSGIGRDAVLRFVREGARVIFTGRNPEGAAATREALGEHQDRASYGAQDVGNETDWQALGKAVKSELGGLDVLVNNAGAFWVKFLQDMTLEDFKSMWRVNVDGTFLGIRYGAEWMADQAGGSVVNVSSLSGLVTHPMCAGYCSTKAAIVMMSRAAALEFDSAPRVNVLTPGPVWNELLERTHGAENAEAMKQFYTDTSPLKVLGDSTDVTHGIVYLASDESRYVNGAVIRIDAGRGAD